MSWDQTDSKRGYTMLTPVPFKGKGVRQVLAEKLDGTRVIFTWLRIKQGACTCPRKCWELEPECFVLGLSGVP